MEVENAGISSKIILLDVYETILDMSEVERHVNQLMNSKRGYHLWFELFMEYTFADNNTGEFHEFSSIAAATLRMTAYLLNKELESHGVEEIVELMKRLPIKEGVQKGLSGFSDKNFRIAALTNSPEAIVKERMENTGLISYFEMVLSAERIKKYKPAIEVYEWALQQLKAKAEDVLLVSAHSWDIAGGNHAGLQTAFVQQDKQLFYPLAPKPTFTCKNLFDLCEQLDKVPESVQI